MVTIHCVADRNARSARRTSLTGSWNTPSPPRGVCSARRKRPG